MGRKGIQISALALGLFAGSASALEMDLGKASMTANVGSLVQVDSTKYLSDDKTNSYFKSGVNVRRMDLSIYGNVDNWSYKVGAHKSRKDELVYDDAYATYDMGDVKFSLGWMAPEVGLENSTSVAYINALEGSLPAQTYAISPLRGVMINKDMGSIKLTGGFYLLDREKSKDLSYASSSFETALAGRLTFMRKNMLGNACHFGVSAYFANPDVEWVGNNNAYKKFGPNNLGLRGLEYAAKKVSLYNIAAQPENVRLYFNLETAAVRNNISFLVEGYYGRLNFGTTDLPRPDVTWGLNAEAAWVVTGEQRSYNMSKHTLAGVVPSSSKGALEVFARYSYLDLTTENVENNAKKATTVYLSGKASGAALGATDVLQENSSKSKKWMKMQNLTLGGTWYANEHASIKTNLVINWLPYAVGSALWGDSTETTRYLVGGAVRAQIAW